MVAIIEVADFNSWHKGFVEHATSKTGSWGFEVPSARSEFCNESKTQIYLSTKSAGWMGNQRILALINEVDMEKLGPCLADPNFKRLETALGERNKIMKVSTPMPPAAPKPDLAITAVLSDYSKWIAGFNQHATGTVISGTTVAMSRAEMMDEKRTEVFRGGPWSKHGCTENHIAVLAWDCDMEKLGSVMGSPAFQKVEEDLGLISKDLRVIVDPPPEPA